jgi:predicted secreted hydrolase
VKRREWLIRALCSPIGALPGLSAATGNAHRTDPIYPPVLEGQRLRFPRDHGAHPDFRTEWWYATGWLEAGGIDIGMQITFFRARTGHSPDNPSRFAPTQLILGHAALAIAGEPRLRHGQRSARAGFGLAQASVSDTDLTVLDWSFTRRDGAAGTGNEPGTEHYLAIARTEDFALELALYADAPPVLQGVQGYSRKGPMPAQASYYYSRPHLRIEGRLRIGSPGASMQPARGRGWLDHEWSSELLDPRATGWDWVGLNLDDGSALMAFRIRDSKGGELWKHARWIDKGSLRDASAHFTVLREWRSLRSGASYPVAMRLTLDTRELELQPLIDDQELDTHASTGTIYWEGAVRVLENGRPIGRGYLELTGYAGRVKL